MHVTFSSGDVTVCVVVLLAAICLLTLTGHERIVVLLIHAIVDIARSIAKRGM